MHRSSDSIGTIAAALAKAQAELTNPAIRSPLHREGDRSFRYAPLSSGLDIVRKGLGRYEIATIQTTAIDKDAGLLRLTTVLAHSSGEWISSEWPVCPIADIASSQRMGAALTYARRYALFTLVGIAGEDDLDAPDLCDGSLAPSAPAVDRFKPREGRVSPRTPGNADARDVNKRRPPVILDADQSAALREKLLAEMGNIASADLAPDWAREALIAKNSLTATDAKLLEDAFEQRLSELASSESAGSSSDAPEHPSSVLGPQGMVATESRDPQQKGPRHCRAASLSRSRTPSPCCQATLPRMRPQAVGPASSSLRAATGPRSQGQRRVRGPALSNSSSVGAPRRQRSSLVEGRWHRPDQGRPQALETDPRR